MDQCLLPVIILTDLSHRYQSQGVLVGIRGVDIVEGGGAGGITIGARKVDGHGEVDLTATHDVVQERVQPDYLGKARQNLIKNLINASTTKQKRPQ